MDLRMNVRPLGIEDIDKRPSDPGKELLRMGHIQTLTTDEHTTLQDMHKNKPRTHTCSKKRITSDLGEHQYENSTKTDSMQYLFKSIPEPTCTESEQVSPSQTIY